MIGPLFLLGSLAIGGSPPFGPFTSEFAILAGTFAARAYLPAALLLACLAAIFAGLLYHAMRVVFGAAPKRLRDPRRVPSGRHAEHWPLVVAFALILLLGVWVPPPLRDAVTAAANVLPVRPAPAGAAAPAAPGRSAPPGASGLSGLPTTSGEGRR